VGRGAAIKIEAIDDDTAFGIIVSLYQVAL
jgi:hypothetical protein